MLSIRQKKFLNGEQVYSIDGDKLKVRWKKGFSLNEFTLDVDELNPEPQRYRYVPAGWLILFTLVFLGYIIGFILIFTSYPKDYGGLFSFLFFVGIIIVVIGLNSKKKWINTLTFYGTGGQISLWPNLPNKEEYEIFVKKLIDQIKDSKEQKSRHEYKFIDILKTEGVLDEWQYEQAVEILKRMGK